MKKNIKKLFAVTLAVALVFSFAACGNDTSDEDMQTYLAITEPTYPPFDTTDENGNIVGFDMDLLNAIAEDQGFKVEYQAMEFDSLIPALVSGSADIIAAGMNSDDPDRQAKVDFSDSYYNSGLIVLVRADENRINGIEDLSTDTIVGSQMGTTGADECNALAKKGTIKDPMIIGQFTTLVLQLQNGDIDAILIDKAVAENFIRTSGDNIKIVGDVLNAESYGFAVQKGNSELQEKINAGLKNCINNGTYDELFAKWIESDEDK